MISKATPLIAGLALVAGVAIGWFADAKWGRAAAHSGDGPGAANVTVAAAKTEGGRVEASSSSSSTTQPVASDDGVSVYFSPNGGCTAAILREIGAARQSVHVQAAQFTSSAIAKALVAAHNRGIDVQVVVDHHKSENKTQADRLQDAGIPTFTDARHGTAHNKVILVDGKVVITGSFNFTKDSETENAENLVFLRDKPAVAAAYEENFRRHLEHSDRYEK
jgi:phosphatidylserine/phosphatidylglycerophosphate/cardiolipin synthase-like enzyme